MPWSYKDEEILESLKFGSLKIGVSLKIIKIHTIFCLWFQTGNITLYTQFSLIIYKQLKRYRCIKKRKFWNLQNSNIYIILKSLKIIEINWWIINFDQNYKNTHENRCYDEISFEIDRRETWSSIKSPKYYKIWIICIIYYANLYHKYKINIS